MCNRLSNISFSCFFCIFLSLKFKIFNTIFLYRDNLFKNCRKYNQVKNYYIYLLLF